jgi:hypothetical protein
MDGDPHAQSAPAPFRQTSPYTLELRESAGWMAVFGLPFFVAGGFLALTLTGVLPFEVTPRRAWGPVVLGLMSLVFLGVGGVFLFGRRWLTLDLARGSVIRRQGLLIPMRREERHLNEFTAVVIAFDSGDSDSPERYPVRLRAATGKDFVISTPAQFSESRKQAEYLCRFLRLPLADTTTDHETVVTPERASATLRDRLLSSKTEAERPIQPPRMLSEVTESPGDARIVIPGPRFPSAGVLGVVFSSLVLLILIPAILRSLSPNQSIWGVQPAFLILVLILAISSIVGGVNLMIGSRRNRTTVKASPAGLVIERRSAWRTRTKVVYASDILDLDQSTFEGVVKSMTVPPGVATQRFLAALRNLAPGKGIVVKSRQELITFGEGLPLGELQYLSWVLRKALAAS